MPDEHYGDFEFERRFWVQSLPVQLLDAPTAIVQGYVLAADGYAIRVRATIPGLALPQDLDIAPIAVLEQHQNRITVCTLTAKGPMIGGTRYEAERELASSVGIEMIRRSPQQIAKTRYSAWLGADGWVIDVFTGAHAPLIIAECERANPVTDLAIPTFCTTEITSDARFSNDSLCHRPYQTWESEFMEELQRNGPQFDEGFGKNTTLATP